MEARSRPGGSSPPSQQSSSSFSTRLPSATNIFQLDAITVLVAIAFGIILTAIQYYFERRDAAAKAAETADTNSCSSEKEKVESKDEHRHHVSIKEKGKVVPSPRRRGSSEKMKN